MQMIDELGVNFPVLFDARKRKSAKLYNVEAMPVTVIVDRSIRHGASRTPRLQAGLRREVPD